MSNPLPEYVTKAQVDEALRALGIPERIGLVSLEIGHWKMTVRRYVKPNGSARGIPGGAVDPAVLIEIPIQRWVADDECPMSGDDKPDPFMDRV